MAVWSDDVRSEGWQTAGDSSQNVTRFAVDT